MSIWLRPMRRSFQLNKRLPYFFRDRSTEYFGLIHSALFGSETVELEEAEKLLGISEETIAQLRQYEEEREHMEASQSKIQNKWPRLQNSFPFYSHLPYLSIEYFAILKQQRI